MEYFTQTLKNLEDRLQEINSNPAAVYTEFENGIKECKEVLRILRFKVEKDDFLDHDEECWFFKTVKPKIVGYVIHFMNRLQLDRMRPYGNTKTERKFNLAQIGSLQSYFWDNKEFFDYHIRGLAYRIPH